MQAHESPRFLFGLLLAAMGCSADSVIGTTTPRMTALPPPAGGSAEPAPAQPAPNAPAQPAAGAPAQPAAGAPVQKTRSTILAKPGEQIGLNNPILGDADGDGFDDFFVEARVAPFDVFGSRIYLFYGKPQFPMQLTTADADAAFQARWGAVALGDVNGDGLADFALEHGASSEIVFGTRTRYAGEQTNNASGTRWDSPLLSDVPADKAQTIGVRTAGDVNGDGSPDLLVNVASMSTDPDVLTTTAYGLLSTQHLVLGHAGTWMFGRWDASWAVAQFGYKIDEQPLQGKSLHPLEPIAVGDLDGDGASDLIAQTGQGHISVAAPHVFYGGPGKLTGSLTLERTDAKPVLPGWVITSSRVGDLDGDRFDDLVVVNVDTYYISVIYGSTQRWADAQTVTAAFTAQLPHQLKLNDLGQIALGAGDVNADGLIDLVISVRTLGRTASPTTPDVFAMPPIGSMYVIRGTGERWTGVRELDSRDLMMSAPAPQAEPTGYRPSVRMPFSMAGDIDGDGSNDILASGGTVRVPSAPDGAVYIVPSTPK